MRRILLILVFLLAITAVVFFFWQRARVQAAVGPAVALCPGPDFYGYTCDNGRAYAYIDATKNSGLQALDGLVTLDLPFPFTFYGTTYEQIQALTNGNLQFNNGNVNYENQCLDTGPAPNMGDMIAPYWTDLDLRFSGALETAVVGQPPNRIFVIEWDSVPPFNGTAEESVTFEVQLFETTNDILFFYADVNGRGAQATAGIQSEAQGVALQYSCNSPVINGGTSLHIIHPERPNPDLGQQLSTAYPPTATAAAREPVTTIMAQLEHLGPDSLSQQRTRWLRQTPARALDWRWAAVMDHGRGAPTQLVLLSQSDNRPDLTNLAVLELDDQRQTHLLYNAFPATADNPLANLSITAVADLTGDTLDDIVFHDPTGGRVFVLTAHTGELAWLTVPGRCSGSLGVLDANSDGQIDIVRDGCDAPGRVIMAWHGRGFVPTP